MKDFLKMTLAVICGLVVTTVILCIIGFGTLGALLAAGSSTPVLPKEGVLTLDMSKIVLAEQSTGTDPFSAIAGGSTTTIGIWDAVQAVNRAASDPTVQYIYLRTDNSASGLSGIEELRAALENFRTTSGKAVVSYLEFPSLGGYYLASVADKVYMSSYLGATPMMTGVSAQMTFLGDLLSRLGINVQLIRHGKYKSAGEMYTRSSSSPENREQYENWRRVNCLPAGQPTNLFLFGKRIKLVGEDPNVSITFLSPTGESYVYHPADVVYNTPSSLLLPPRFELTPGTWKCTLQTQYREAGGLYKAPRQAILQFTVSENPPA